MKTASQKAMDSVLRTTINSYLKEMELNLLAKFDAHKANEVKEQEKIKDDALNELEMLVKDMHGTVEENLDDLSYQISEYEGAIKSLKTINKKRVQIINVIGDLKVEEN